MARLKCNIFVVVVVVVVVAFFFVDHSGGYFLNFTQYGLQINAGHEVMMDRVWMGETNFDFDHEKLGSRPNATAIQVNPTVQTQLPTVH